MTELYLGIENIALNDIQKRALVEALKALGPDEAGNPRMLNHWRIRLDGEAAFFQANFKDENLTVDAFKGFVADVFGIDPDTIDHTLSEVTYSERPTPILTLSYLGTDYIRFALFGGVDATWMESGNEVRAYLAQNRSEWEGNV